jgi:hypothetical protein
LRAGYTRILGLSICMGFFAAGERLEGVAVGDRLTDTIQKVTDSSDDPSGDLLILFRAETFNQGAHRVAGFV